MIFFRAWIAMLAIGALHSDYSAVPALGYSSVLLTLVVADALFFRPNIKAEVTS